VIHCSKVVEFGYETPKIPMRLISETKGRHDYSKSLKFGSKTPKISTTPEMNVEDEEPEKKVKCIIITCVSRDRSIIVDNDIDKQPLDIDVHGFAHAWPLQSGVIDPDLVPWSHFTSTSTFTLPPSWTTTTFWCYRPRMLVPQSRLAHLNLLAFFF
jgi:hypothetical protein